MSKIETIFHGYKIVVERLIENAGIPNADLYRVTAFGNDNHYKDEIQLTEAQWGQLKKFALDGSDGVVCEPFYDEEIEKEFQPRFGGANPKYKDFYRAGWYAAFEYVNNKIRKAKI